MDIKLAIVNFSMISLIAVSIFAETKMYVTSTAFDGALMFVLTSAKSLLLTNFTADNAIPFV